MLSWPERGRLAGREISFGNQTEGIAEPQQHLDILNPGYRFLQEGGAWTVEAGTSAS